MNPNEPELPGILEAVTNHRGNSGKSALLEATRATVTALDIESLLEPRHQALVALALDLAETIDAVRSARNPRASAIAMLVKEYRETLDALPEPSVEGKSKLQAFLDAKAAAREKATA